MSKPSTKQILRMNDKTIESKCKFQCNSEGCLFREGIRELREDGFCIKDMVRLVDGWIEEDNAEIMRLESLIKKHRRLIDRYEEFKKEMKKDGVEI